MHCGIERQRLGLRWWKHTKKRDDDIFYKENEKHLVSATWSFLLLNCSYWQHTWAVNSMWSEWSFMPCFLCRGQQASTQQEVLTREAGVSSQGDGPEKQGRVRDKTHVLKLYAWTERTHTNQYAPHSTVSSLQHSEAFCILQYKMLSYSYKRKE